MENLSTLDVVALLAPCNQVPVGAVGTVVEVLEPDIFLIEFSDDNGRPLAIETAARENLLKLHYDFAKAA
jgi:hypothetical protein